MTNIYKYFSFHIMDNINNKSGDNYVAQYYTCVQCAN